MKARHIACLLLCLGVSAHAQELDTCLHLHEVMVTGVTGAQRVNQVPAPVSTVSATELESHFSTNVIDALSKQAGVSQITTGNGISKPVIRGLGYNRVLVVNGGVRQEGQQWGDEHGVEIDGQSIHSVEIMKGPASLMYGSDALAGVLVFHDAPALMEGDIRVNAAGEYHSNGNLRAYTVDFAGNQQGWLWDWRWSDKASDSYKNPRNGTVDNSQFREQALNGMFGLSRSWGVSRLKLSYYHFRPGIIEVGEEEEEEGDEETAEEHPFQRINHYKAVLDNSIFLGEGQLKAIIGYQHNRRKEFETPDECGLDFLLQTVNYDLRYVSPEWSGWKTNVGVGGMWQESQNKGTEYLIPAYRFFDFGVFATASKSFIDRLHLSGGLRFDTRHLNSHQLEDRFEAFSRNFSGLTGSVGAIYNLQKNLDLRLNVARGYRAPNLSELGSNGEHEGTFRYEIGNHQLDPEFSWQFDAGLDYSSEVFSAQLSLFFNRISNYIYAEKAGREQEGVPVFLFTQGDARLFGGEATVILHPFKYVHWENAFSYVNSKRLHVVDKDAEWLPLTPVPRWLSTLHYDLNGKQHWLRNLFVELQMDVNLRQNHYYKVNGTESETPSYTLFNITTGTDILRRGEKLFSIYAFCNNLFDRSYVSHLNRLKSAGIYNMGRDIGVKLVFSL